MKSNLFTKTILLAVFVFILPQFGMAQECGNGYKDPGEECDDGNTVSGDGCSADCLSSEICGNGYLDVIIGEQCDDGNTIAGDGCSPTCLNEICGNGYKDPGEECDDGNTVSGDGCSADCLSNETCGNGYVDIAIGEECDDGNTAYGDGCSSDCLTESPQCVPRLELSCGDTDSANNGGPGSTNLLNGYSCSSWNESGPEYTYWFVAPSTAPTVTTTLSGMGVIDLDLFILDGISGTCEAGNCIAYHNSSASFPTVASQTYYIVVDGYFGSIGDFNISLTCTGICGDGVLNPGEECDDGNTTAGDGCDASCLLECGNGVVDTGEVCDDWNTTAGDGCSADCLSNETCGNGYVDIAIGEECDDGNITGGDGCDVSCLLECGNGVVDSGEECDDGNTVSGDGCSADCLSNETCGNGYVDIAIGEECDDGNTTAGDGCSADCLSNETCGNGVVDSGEECDDGNTIADDGCGPTCRVEKFPWACFLNAILDSTRNKNNQQ